jgi:hypothetical protein
MLSRPVDAAASLPPVRSDPVLTTAHRDWAAVHDGTSSAAGTGGAGRGWRQRLSQLMARAVRASLQPRQQEDRMLIGDLLRAVDTLAARCDALADRVVALEQALAEVVDVLGADLTQIRADLAARHESGPSASPTPGPPPHDG